MRNVEVIFITGSTFVRFNCISGDVLYIYRMYVYVIQDTFDLTLNISIVICRGEAVCIYYMCLFVSFCIMYAVHEHTFVLCGA